MFLYSIDLQYSLNARYDVAGNLEKYTENMNSECVLTKTTIKKARSSYKTLVLSFCKERSIDNIILLPVFLKNVLNTCAIKIILK